MFYTKNAPKAADNSVSSAPSVQKENPVGIARLLVFLCLFIRNTKIATLVERRNALSIAIEDFKIRNTRPGKLAVHKIFMPDRLCLFRTIEAKDGESALLALGGFYDELICKGVHISRDWPAFCEYPDYGLLNSSLHNNITRAINTIDTNDQ